MKTVLYKILPTLLLLSACTASDDQLPSRPDESRAIGITASIASADESDSVTRTSATEYNTTEALKTLGFGVFASNTGLHRYSDSNVSSNFMYNEHVEWNATASAWTYSPIKYWPNGEGEANTGDNSATGQYDHFVSFFAYAPYSDNDGSAPATNSAGYCIQSFSLQHEVTNPWLNYRLYPQTDAADQAFLTNQVDLLWANPLIDRTKQTTTGRLPFEFKHALACVGDKVTLNVSEAMKATVQGEYAAADGQISKIEVALTSLQIDYTLTQKARLVLWTTAAAYTANEANWQPILSENFTTSRIVQFLRTTDPEKVIYTYDGSDAPVAAEYDDKGVFYIPLQVGGQRQTATIRATYVVRAYTTAAGDPTTVERTTESAVTLNLADYTAAYKPGKRLDFGIEVNEKTLLVKAAIAKWEDVSSTYHAQ